MTRALRASVVILVASGATGLLYTAGPPPAHTGGFGEETCAYCHFENPVDDPAGALTIGGVPDSYAPGKTYPLEILLTRRDLARGGFQVSARFADGPHAGTQAGSLKPQAELVSADTLGGIVYVRQTYPGSEPYAPDSIRWLVDWRAPSESLSHVVFHVAANAANGDDSEFGDFIYLAEIWSHARSD